MQPVLSEIIISIKQTIMAKRMLFRSFYFLFLFLFINSQQSFSQKIFKTYYDYLNLKIKEEYQIDKEGLKNGYYKSYYENKGAYEVGQYKDDQKTGMWRIYELDGKLKEEGNYVDNEYNGLVKVWINGAGYHYLGADHYYDKGEEIRTITYYREGGIQSDIKKDGECKFLYKNGKPAKVWQSQNGKAVLSTVKIWSIEGELFEVQKQFGNVLYVYNSDVEYDYSGEISNQIGYYIKPPTKYEADSAGWKILIYKGDEYYPTFIVQKEKLDTVIVQTYKLKEQKAIPDLLWNLRFLNNPDIYLSTVYTYTGKNSDGTINTVKESYDVTGNLKQEVGITDILNGQYRFTAKSQSQLNKQTGSLNISISEISDPKAKKYPSADDESSETGKIKGSILNTKQSFEYDKSTSELTIFIDNKKYLVANISLFRAIPKIIEENWHSVQSDKGSKMHDLEKCLNLLDNSCQTFFYYANIIQIYDNNGFVKMTLTNPEPKKYSYYFRGNEKLEEPIVLEFKNETNSLNLKVTPDNKTIFDQFTILDFVSDKILFEPKETVGFLRNDGMDIGQELLKFANKYKE